MKRMSCYHSKEQLKFSIVANVHDMHVVAGLNSVLGITCLSFKGLCELF